MTLTIVLIAACLILLGILLLLAASLCRAASDADDSTEELFKQWNKEDETQDR